MTFFSSCDQNIYIVIVTRLFQGRIHRFWKGGTLCWPPWLAEEENLVFRWSKKAKLTLESVSFGQNISISIFNFFPFLYTMKACQWNLILIMNITQTIFLYWQNVHIWRLIKAWSYIITLWLKLMTREVCSL